MDKIKSIARRFWRRYALLIIATLIFCVYGYAMRAVTTIRVTKEVTAEVTERVTAELTAQFQQKIASMATDTSSEEAAIESEADALARLMYGYSDNSSQDRKTLIWCVLSRVDSSAYPDTVEGVVNQPDQWMFYDKANPIRKADKAIAKEMLQMWHSGTYPDGFSRNLVFAEWTETDVRLRNTWDKTPSTTYWRYPD